MARQKIGYYIVFGSNVLNTKMILIGRDYNVADFVELLLVVYLAEGLLVRAYGEMATAT